MTVNDLMRTPRELRINNPKVYMRAIDYVLDLKELRFMSERVHMLMQVEFVLNDDLKYLATLKSKDSRKRMEPLFKIRDDVFTTNKIITKIEDEDIRKITN